MLWSLRLTLSSTSDTEKPPTPDDSTGRLAQDFVDEVPIGSDYSLFDSLFDGSSGCRTAVSSGSSGLSEINNSSDDTFGLGPEEHLFDQHAPPYSWPVTLSPDKVATIYTSILELGVGVEDKLTKTWIDAPVSYIPATHPQGPRAFAENHYACPYPGCTEPFGASDTSVDGYLDTSLVKHVYRRHGYGPAVDLLSFGLRTRVMSLRVEQGMAEFGDHSYPRAWKNPGWDLERASFAIIEDLEEIRAWERVQQGDIISATPAKRKKESPPLQQLDKGKGKAVATRVPKITGSSPEDPSAMETTMTPPSPESTPAAHTPWSRHKHHAAHLRDDGFDRDCSPSLLHQKEELQSPTKTSWLNSPVSQVPEDLTDDILELLDQDDFELSEIMDISWTGAGS